jgi:hypothetical protein
MILGLTSGDAVKLGTVDDLQSLLDKHSSKDSNGIPLRLPSEYSGYPIAAAPLDPAPMLHLVLAVTLF